jgi:uncharacterized protein (TIGR02001 family)
MFRLAVWTGILLAAASAAQADDPPKQITFTGTTSVVSDYRYRGLSLTNDRPALQGDVTATTTSGVYGDLFASTIAYGSAHQELDFTMGQKVPVAGFVLDVAVTRYAFLGGHQLDYWELPVAVSRTQGAWTWTGGAAYVPPQRDTLNRSNFYEFGRTEWKPVGSYSVVASAGWEDGAFAKRKLDWSLTGTKRFKALSLSVAWIGYREMRTSNTLVGSVGVGF